MSDQDSKRLRRILLWSWFLILIILIGIVTYFSLTIAKVNADLVGENNRITTNVESMKALQKKVDQLASQAQTPGPEGKAGKDGKDGTNSTSTNTVVEKQTIEQVPVNGKDGHDGKDGEDARPVMLCKLDDGTIGWAYVGSNICRTVEVLQ